MTQPAARIGDNHTCPMQTPGSPPIPHVGGPILPPGAVTVFLDNQPAARVGDQAFCAPPAPPDSIVRGAFPALIGGQPAARQGDSTAHGGTIAVGTPKVLIGAAGTSGNPWVGKTVCQNMAAGRSPPPGALDPNGNQLQAGTPGQSYNNCGIESSRQILSQANGSNISQEGLLNQAMTNGWANQVPGNLFASGGSVPAGKVSLLAANGVSATQMAPTMQNLELAAAQGRGVISDVWAAKIWPANVVTASGMVPGSNNGAHSILVTGIEYDANGNPTNVVVNDTGMGTCGQKIPAAQFQNALIGGGNNHVVTNSPMW